MKLSMKLRRIVALADDVLRADNDSKDKKKINKFAPFNRCDYQHWFWTFYLNSAVVDEVNESNSRFGEIECLLKFWRAK